MKKSILLIFTLIFVVGCSNNSNPTEINGSGGTNGKTEISDSLTIEEVENSLKSMATCNTDSDCQAFYGECPLNCHYAVNKDNLEDAENLISNWIEKQNDMCVYDCVGIRGAACQSGKCVPLIDDIKGNSENTNLINYEDILNVAGVGPEISFESTVSEGTLVLHKTFEDHSDHIFFEEKLWKNFEKEDDLTLPGNKVSFKGLVVALDAAAGNHYYQVKEITELKKTGNPTQEEVESLFTSFSFCEQDSDCEYFYGDCPISCQNAVNKKYIDISKKIMTNFVDSIENKCEYKCMEIKGVTCNNYKCETN